MKYAEGCRVERERRRVFVDNNCFEKGWWVTIMMMLSNGAQQLPLRLAPRNPLVYKEWALHGSPFSEFQCLPAGGNFIRPGLAGFGGLGRLGRLGTTWHQAQSISTSALSPFSFLR